MAQGYLVQLANGQLDSNDAITIALVGFTAQSSLGTGTWTFSGIENGSPVSNQTATGSYQLGTDGNVYFVPASSGIDSVSAATAGTVPSYSDITFGTASGETLQGGSQSEIFYGGSSASPSGTGDDTITAGDGQDIVHGGDGADRLIGGGGNDSVFGGDGADTIYGDTDTASPTTETLQWITATQPNNTDLSGGFTQDTGGMQVSVQFTNDGANTGITASASTQHIGAESLATNSSLGLSGNAAGGNVTASIVFNAGDGSNLSNEVSNVTFIINDLDAGGHQDIVTVNAYDADGNPVTVVMSPYGDDLISGQTVTGVGNDTQAQAGGSALVTIAGPVHSIEIVYANGGSSAQALWVTDVQFTTMTPEDGDDLIDGGAGNDLIFGGGGDDRITAGADDDTVYGGAGDDTVTLGAGNDSFGAAGSEAGNDTVWGDGGDDTINGGAGDDLIYGGTGNDLLTGGAGTDTLFGGTGNDTFAVSDDHDSTTIVGGENTGDLDTVTFASDTSSDGVRVTFNGAEAGTFAYEGSTASGNFSEIEAIRTTGQDDTINAASASGGTRIDAMGGNDSITGSSSADIINAGTGADIIRGGAGNDAIDLGADTAADTLVITNNFGADIISNFTAPTPVAGGFVTNDRVDISGLIHPNGHAVYAEHVAVSDDGAGNAVLTFPEGSSLTLIGISPALMGTPGALAAIGIPNGDGIIFGTNGNDLIDASYSGDESGDQVDANDALIPGAAANDDLIYGGNGRDTIIAGDGNDRAYGDTGNDDLFGGAGNDALYGGFGNDTLSGDDGQDQLYGGADSDSLYGGNGADRLFGGDAGDVLYGGDGNDLIDAGNGADSVWGDAGDDTITMGDGANVIRGGTGNDTITGNTGSDLIYGEDDGDKIEGAGGDDSLFGGNGDDSLSGGVGHDVVDGGDDSDLVHGDAGDDTVFGGRGDDTVFGGAGNDVVHAGPGDDLLYGEDGDDLFIVEQGLGGFGRDQIFGGEGDETTGDVLDATALTGDLSVFFSSPENGSLSEGRASLDFADIEEIRLGSGSDFVSGSDAADTVFTGTGSDTVYGGAGDDRIDMGGADGDVDVVGLQDFGGNDTVSGFEAPIDNGDGTFTGLDQLEVSGITLGGRPITVADVVVSDDGSGNAVLGFPNATSVTLLGISPASVASAAALNAMGIPMLNFTVEGTSGDDVIDAFYTDDPQGDRVDSGDAADGSDDDVIFGYEGEDSLNGGLGNDTIFGGADNDSVIGEEGDDVLYGGDGRDFLNGVEGDDTLFGGAGNDFIESGSGHDETHGDAGDDSINGDMGDDTMFGGAGNDYVRGSFGNDTVYGGEGDDFVWGGFGDDIHVVENNFGNDTYFGDSEQETNGDTLDFSAVTDAIRLDLTAGGSEQGSFTDGTYTATFTEIENIVLGGGIDTIVLADNSGSDRVQGFTGPTDNGDGTFTGVDQLDVSGLTSDFGTTPVTVADVTVTDDGTGNAVLTFPGGENITLVGVSPASLSTPEALNAIGIPIRLDGTVNGTNGDDLIDTGYVDDQGDRIDANDQVLPGAAANDDLVEAGAGNDTVLAGNGHDEVYGDFGDDILDGGAGNDSLFGGAGSDTLIGGSGNDALFGDEGADSILGGTGADLIDAGAGNDRVSDEGATNAPVSTASDTVFLGDGDDIFIGTGLGIPDQDTVYGGAGNDTISVRQSFDTVYGGDGDDVITTEDEWETYGDALYGDAGNDRITGANTNDSLFGGTGNDTLSGMANTDTLYGGAGDDTLFGGADNDQLFGDAGNDSLWGGTGDDTLQGGDGNDLLRGEAGNDTLSGDEGDDRLVGEAGNDTLFGGAGNDRLEGGLDNDELSGGAGNDTNFGSTGNDTIFGGDGDDEVFGEQDNDLLHGGTGNDTIEGNWGDDTIFGGAGDDIIAGAHSTLNNGQTGNDTLYGGDGADRFVLTNDMGTSLIEGGEGGTDRDTIDAGVMTGGVSITFSGDEAGTITGGTAAATSTFSEIEAFGLTGQSDALDASASTQSVSVRGRAGDDVLTGGAGNDSLSGDGGEDTLTGGLGADALFGGTGNDTLRISDGDTGDGGIGDDLFIVEDLGEAGNGTITINGGSDDETTGDTLDLNGLADFSSLISVDDGTGSFSGSVTLLDGTLLNFTDIENIICFTPGTHIATPRGARQVQDLAVGDLVVTRDHGLQPIRWIGTRTVPATGSFAPIRIRPGVLTGLEADLVVSPQHRMLFQGYRAELLFGESEVLVAAKHLLDGRSVTVDHGGMVTYIHILFDEHEIVFAEGAATESFHPGEVGLSAVTEAAREELFTLFPELRGMPKGYGRTARRCLRAHEAKFIV